MEAETNRYQWMSKLPLLTDPVVFNNNSTTTTIVIAIITMMFIGPYFAIWSNTSFGPSRNVKYLGMMQMKVRMRLR